MNKSKLLNYLVVFLTTFLLLQWFQGGKGEDTTLTQGDIGVMTVKDSYVVGGDIQVTVQNNTDQLLTLENPCPDPFLKVSRFTSEGYLELSNTSERDCTHAQALSIAAGEKATLSLADYSYSLFGSAGKYKVSLTLPTPTVEDPTAIKEYTSPEFDVEEPGILRSFYRTVIYQPILNLLVALLIYIPGHYLGLGILALTLIIRTLLLLPSQKAMKAQKRMQNIQPKLEELKKTHANDQTRLAQETMLLWKTEKVNPVSSCLPMLIQMPILIALFHAINGGLSPDKQVLIYDFLPSFSLSEINPNLLDFNLLDHSLIVLPILIGALQFLQMQLMMARKNKKGETSVPKEMESANKIMKYMMPIMLALFTARLPAAVGLYWGVSTCYGIVQQIVVNKGSSKEPPSNDEDVKVRVINRNHGKAN